MLTMINKEKFLIENTNFINEYDKANFISISNNALNKGNHLNLIDISHFDDNFRGLDSLLDNLKIPFSKDLIIYFNTISNLDRINNRLYKMISTTNLNKTIVIRPEYLLQASNSIIEIVNKIISGELNARDIYTDKFANRDEYSSILKQRVVSDINDYDTTQSLFTKKYINVEDDSIIVPVDREHIQNEIIPFIKDFQNIKTNFKNDINKSSNFIHDALINVNDAITIINNNAQNIDNDTFMSISEYVYNHVRSIIDTASVVLYLNISRCFLLEQITNAITSVYNSIVNQVSDCENLIESGIFDSEISVSESEKISNNLLNGNNDIFVETADIIMEYHNNYILSQVYPDNIPEINNNEFTSIVASRYNNYDKTLLESVNDIYDEINEGLTNISNKINNKFLVVDKLIKESGLDKPLIDKYGYIIEMVSDVNDYNDFSVSDTYFNLIGEISNYKENTDVIAKNAKDIMSKIKTIKESTTNMADDIIKEELNTVIESVEKQFISINKNIATDSYRRLKLLAEKADYALNGNFDNDYPEIIIGDNTEDFHKECFLNLYLDEINHDNDILMESMLKGYYSEREYLEKGIRIIYEDVGTQTSGTTTQPQTNNTTPSVNTSSTASVVSDQNTNNAQNFEKLSTKIKTLIEKIINTFRDFINKFKKKNLEWLNKHKSELINRSYSNVSIKVLPYHTEMPETQLFTFYDTMEKNVDNVAKKIHNIKSREEMRGKLFTFTNLKFEGDDVDESKVLTNYFKVGSKPLNTVTYSNKEVKSLVIDVMIPYCERYYTKIADEVAKYSQKLIDVSSKYKENSPTVQTTESTSILIEAEQGQQAQQAQPTVTQNQQQVQQQTQVQSQQQNNQQQTNDNTPKYSEQYSWLSGLIGDFVGSICNATRARNDDYIKILSALVPKKKILKNSNNEQTTTTTDTQ